MFWLTDIHSNKYFKRYYSILLFPFYFLNRTLKSEQLFQDSVCFPQILVFVSKLFELESWNFFFLWNWWTKKLNHRGAFPKGLWVGPSTGKRRSRGDKGSTCCLLIQTLFAEFLLIAHKTNQFFVFLFFFNRKFKI